MPPKSKRQRTYEENLEKARESKRICLSGETTLVTSAQEPSLDDRDLNTAQPQRVEPQELIDWLNLSVDALDTEDESVDPSFDMDSSIKSDSGHMTETFCEDWVTHLDWEDRASLGLFLCFQIRAVLGKGETEAAE